MPALEMAQDSAMLVRWTKNEGEYVSKGEVLMEVETDKATIEIESTGSGVLSRVTAHAGDQIPVGQVIAVLLDADGHSPAQGGPVVTASQRGAKEQGATPAPDSRNVQG